MAENTVLLLDPHPLWLDAVEQTVNRAGARVVGKATSTSAASTLLEQSEPDIVVMELGVDGGRQSGASFIRSVRDRETQPRIIVLSQHDDADSIDAAFEAGASAYVVKTAHPDDITSAIRQSFSTSVFLRSAPRTPAQSPAQREAAELPGLTRREVEILRLVAEGHSNAQLARMLWVTEQTVKFHLSNIYRKLDVANRTEASRWAQLNGVLAPAPAEDKELAVA
jgi:DNA-binding NarL/FixJ family response regulator